MKIAICGAGLVGTFLYRLLSRAGLKDVTIFEKPIPPKTSCGINPCAWGTSVGFDELIQHADLDPNKYVFRKFDSIIMNGTQVQAKAAVINKPKLISDLLIDANVQKLPIQMKEFDRIIDASGVARAYLPPVSKDIIYSCIQHRVHSNEIFNLEVNVNNLGYAWRFPLSKDQYHIGAGSFAVQPQVMLDKLGWLKNSTPICACIGKIRLTAPHFSLPFVVEENAAQCQIWGVGEAIGCVAPLVGEGIIPGLKNAILLAANWENPETYQQAILKEFASFKEERIVIDKAIGGKQLGLSEGLIIQKSTERFGVNVGFRLGMQLLKSITRMT
jgi:flavin-dependent dehydrogenase